MPANMPFESFLTDKKYKQGFWGDHVSSWLNEWDEKNFLLVKYEDLLTSSATELKKVLNFLGKQYNDRLVKNACKASSFSSMRKTESEQGRPNQTKDKLDKFVRKGEAGYWNGLFSEKAKTIFKNREGHLLIKLGYENNYQW